MINAEDVVKTLKRMLRERGLTYRDVARSLALTESSVKRLFSEQDFSLKRLETLCALMDSDLSTLMTRAEQARTRISTLSLEQEKLLVSDTRLLLIAVCLVNRWSYEDIVATYQIDEYEAIQALAKLDRFQLIELQPGNRVRLLVSSDFSWRRNGPIQEFFEAQVQGDFFDARFTGAGEIRLFVTGMLSRRANEELRKRLEKIAATFLQLAEEDRGLPLEQRFGSGLMVAMRPWELAAFAALRRQPNRKKF